MKVKNLVSTILILGLLVWFFWPRITGFAPRFWALRDYANSTPIVVNTVNPSNTVAQPPADSQVQILPTITPSSAISTASSQQAGPTGAFPTLNGELFYSPVPATDTFNTDSAWILAEPGVLLDNTATFDRGSSSGEHFVQCPEGGFAYYSLGYGDIQVDDVVLHLQQGKGIINLVLVRCRIDDGLSDTDRNLTTVVTGYLAGNIITSPMPKGAYVSKNWFRQQLEVATGTAQGFNTNRSDGNCGADGCQPWIWLHDADSNMTELFRADTIDTWALMNTN